jgi:hypothetical protein
MIECLPLRKDMLKNPVHLKVADNGLDFYGAKKMADVEAGKITAEPMLLAWYNGKTGEFLPRVMCCGEDKPAWLIYAETRGGNICIDINNEEFVFIYRPFE